MENNFYNRFSARGMRGFVLGFMLLMGLSAFGQTLPYSTSVSGAGTWTCPAGVTSVIVEVWGGGGGGGGASSAALNNSSRAGGGGGAGSYVRATVAVTPGNTYNYTIGAGGLGGTSSLTDYGKVGGASTFTGDGGAILTASGGTGGNIGSSGVFAASGGVLGGMYYMAVSSGGTGYSSSTTSFNFAAGCSSTDATPVASTTSNVITSISFSSQGTGYTCAPSSVGVVSTRTPTPGSGAVVNLASILFNPNINVGPVGATITVGASGGMGNVVTNFTGGNGGNGGTSAQGTLSAPGTGGTGGTVATAPNKSTGTAGAIPGGGGGGGYSLPSSTTAGGSTAGSDGANGLIKISEVVLPVEYTNFQAKTNQKSALLTWTTASEKDNALFNIEQSTNGTDFQTVGQVKGHGTTSASSSYNFEHMTPSVGINYYRLKQVDLGGTATYSAVRSVLFGKTGLVVKNTLVQDALDIVTNDDSATPLSIFNLSGQAVFTGKVQGAQRLNISTLPNGLYIVRTATGDVARFVKQ